MNEMNKTEGYGNNYADGMYSKTIKSSQITLNIKVYLQGAKK